ncbi:MAG: DUF4383 domain-containing protein [Pseudonocardia sp.]
MPLIPQSPTRNVSLVHRVSAATLGVGLCVFGILGFLSQPEFLSTEGLRILGLGSNGLLSTISLIVGAVLIGAAARGGEISSTLTVVIGGLFLLSGLLNIAVLGHPLNVLGFRWPNVFFSLICGLLLLITGSYGRFSAGLPPDNPYYQHRHPHTAKPAPSERSDQAGISAVNWQRLAAAAAEMATAERAVAQGARGEQLTRVRALAGLSTHQDRLQAWLAHPGEQEPEAANAHQRRPNPPDHGAESRQRSTE